MVGEEPDGEREKAAEKKGSKDAEEIYGRHIQVQMTWRTMEEFQENRKYRNTLETRAMRDGVVMPRNPEEHSASYGNGDEEYQTDCRQYEKCLSDSIIELVEFIFMADNNRSDRP